MKKAVQSGKLQMRGMRLFCDMKRKIAGVVATLSGVYLLTIGLMPDPLPFVDEAIVLGIFLKSTSYLGYDLTRWIPFLNRRKKNKVHGKKNVTIDI